MYLGPEHEDAVEFKRAVRADEGLGGDARLPFSRFQMLADRDTIADDVQSEVEPAEGFEVVDSGFAKKVPWSPSA